MQAENEETDGPLLQESFALNTAEKCVGRSGESVPFCLAPDRVHLANDAHALAYKLMHEDEDRMPPEQQQSYMDNRSIPEVASDDEEECPNGLVDEEGPDLYTGQFGFQEESSDNELQQHAVERRK